MDFHVSRNLYATDPEFDSADAKAETAHQVVRVAKTGNVKQLQVSPFVKVKESKYQLVTSTRNS